jgi:hypothetical protein
MSGPFYARRLPVVVQAYRFDGSNGPEIVEWAGTNLETGEPWATWSAYDGLVINTLDGEHIAPIGHWVICGVEGEHYPIKPSVYHAGYEQLGEAVGE